MEAILAAVSAPRYDTRILSWLRRGLPWGIAALLLWWVFSRVPMAAFGQAMAKGHFAWFLPSMAAVMVVIYLADCMAVALTFTWFTAPLSFRDVLRIRGASYLLSVINYNLGQGAIVLFAKRAKGVSIKLGTGTVLLLIGINLVVMLFLSGAALAVGAAPRAEALGPWVMGLLGAFGVYLALLAWKPSFLSKVELFQPILRAGIRGHVLAVLVRLPHLALVIFAHYLAMLAFDIRPPADAFFAYLPVMLLISALPIAPQGLGTAQVAAVFFFSSYAPGGVAEQEATALAYSLTASGTAVVFMLIVGLVWLRSAMSMLGPRNSGSDEAPAEDAASLSDERGAADPEGRRE